MKCVYIYMHANGRGFDKRHLPQGYHPPLKKKKCRSIATVLALLEVITTAVYAPAIGKIKVTDLRYSLKRVRDVSEAHFLCSPYTLI